MLDRDIRAYLNDTHLQKYKQDGESWVVEEMGLSDHKARVDIGVINGKLHAYEIKSDRDNLTRLPGQLEVYNQIFDRITVVCGPKHLGKLQGVLPEHVGIFVTHKPYGIWELLTVREASQNPHRSAYMIASLLWHDEAKSLLVELGYGKGLSKLRRWELWEKLAQYVPYPDDISEYVRRIMKARTTWREASIPLALSDATY